MITKLTKERHKYVFRILESLNIWLLQMHVYLYKAYDLHIYSSYDKQVMKVCMKEVLVAHRKVSKKTKLFSITGETTRTRTRGI